MMTVRSIPRQAAIYQAKNLECGLKNFECFLRDLKLDFGHSSLLRTDQHFLKFSQTLLCQHSLLLKCDSRNFSCSEIVTSGLVSTRNKRTKLQSKPEGKKSYDRWYWHQATTQPSFGLQTQWKAYQWSFKLNFEVNFGDLRRIGNSRYENQNVLFYSR